MRVTELVERETSEGPPATVEVEVEESQVG